MRESRRPIRALMAAMALACAGLPAQAQDGTEMKEPTDVPSALAAFEKRYSSGNPGVRLASLEILVPWDSPEAARALGEVIARDDIHSIQLRAVEILGDWGGAPAAQALVVGAGACGQDETIGVAGRAGAGFRDDESREVFRSAALSAKQKDSRLVGALALALAPDPGDQETLSRLLGERDFRLRRAGAVGLGNLRGTAASACLVEAYPKERDWRVKVSMVEALASCRQADGFPILVDACQHSQTELAVTALKWIGVYPEGFEVLRNAITLPNWALGAAAVRGIVRTRNPEVIPALIHRLDQVHIRVVGEIVYVLEKLAGKQGVGPSKPVWMAWWKEHQKGFVPDWDAPYSEGEASADELVNRANQGEKGQTITFFGLELYTKAVIFILDCSQSMRGSYRSEDIVDASGKLDTRSHIERVKDELVSAVRMMPYNARFNVFFFDKDVRKIFYQMMPAGKENRAKAEKVVARQQAEVNGTNIYAAFMEAFDEKQEIDTIVFLSDGAPTMGEIQNLDYLLDWITEKNRETNAVIHTVSVGSRNDFLDLFMLRLAARNGGRYVRR